MFSLEEVRSFETFEVLIEDYGFTGEGYVRLSDGWLSIRGALPGERVRVRLEPNQREGARRLFAQVVRVVEPSPARRDPLCAFADICHGCQLRHMSMAEEVRWKSSAMVEILQKYVGIEPEDQPPMGLISVPGLWRGDAERVRSNLTYMPTAQGSSLGLRSPKTSGLISMANCPALAEPLQRVIRTVESCVQDVGVIPDRTQEVGGLRAIRVSSPLHGRGMLVFDITGDEVLVEQPWRQLESLSWLVAVHERLRESLPDRISIYWESGALREHISGPARMRLPVAGHTLEVGPADWFHATLRPAEALYEHIVPLFDFREDDRMLDIGCGVGTISVMASEYVAEVVGIDANLQSVETAQLNAFENNLDNVQIIAGSWEKGLRQLALEGRRFDVASINPMREPLGERPLRYLSTLGVARLVYLGPSPVAAARDFETLLSLGWRMVSVAHAMLHPATYHTMLVGAFELT